MTQREQNILDAALLHCKDQQLDMNRINNILEVCGHFACGARWADKTLLDKACKWLIANGYFSKNPESINDFIKAMEE